MDAEIPEVHHYRTADLEGIVQLMDLAFGGVGSAEGRLVRDLVADGALLAPLTMVQRTADGQLLGACVMSRGMAGGAPAVALGPLGVHPEHRTQGHGARLVSASLSAARRHGERLVALLGRPGYYHRFGFVSAVEVGIVAPEPSWVANFQAIVLSPDAPKGTFSYPAAFDALS